MAGERAFAVAELAQTVQNVPSVPGVYVFRDHNGGALYVGKSRDLRARITSYFRPGTRSDRKARALRQFATHVQVELTGSDFGALLREVELVQSLSPPYNVRLRDPERYAYIGVDYHDPYPRLTVTTQPWPGGQFLGPFSNARRVKAAVEVLADVFRLRTCDGTITPDPAAAGCFRLQVRTCSAPCVAATNAGAYGRELLQAVMAITGRSRAARSAWTAERDRLAADLRFETADRRQRQLAALDRLRRNLFISQHVWHDAFVVQPAATAGLIEVWAIAAGSVCQRFSGSPAQLRSRFDALWAALDLQTSANARLVTQSELDVRWIIHRWLTSDEGQRWSVPATGLTRTAAWERLSKLADFAGATLLPLA